MRLILNQKWSGHVYSAPAEGGDAGGGAPAGDASAGGEGSTGSTGGQAGGTTGNEGGAGDFGQTADGEAFLAAPDDNGLQFTDSGRAFNSEGVEVENPANAQENGEERPDWLPEKFKTAESLADAYKELERSFHTKHDVPETYDVKLADGETLQLDDEDVAFFKQQGISNAQANALIQHVRADVEGNLIPQLQEAHMEMQMATLASSWNMEEGSQQFATRMSKLSGWAKDNLPEDVVATLSTSAKGVASMHRMMEAGYNAAGASQSSSSAPPAPSAAELRDMVKDPRYQTDESFRERVEKAFAARYD